ncbi:MAG: biopolymer transporter ExbD [Bacteroidota bacterium]|jgi:biopolymer transport protein ExbD
MNFRKREREASEVETGALADILFFLLMFFLMISTLASPDAIRLLLPKADSTKVTPPVVESIRVSVDANNNFFIDGNAQPFALDQVDGQLKEILKTKKANSLIISIDKSRTVQDLTDVYDLAAKNKLSMVMAAEKKK